MTAATIFAGTNQSALNGGSTNYFTMANGGIQLFSNEDHASINWQTAGTFSKLWVNIVSNSASGTCTVRFRKNTLNGNLSISIATTLTGGFQDSSNTDTIVATDGVAVALTAVGTGSITLATMSCLFSATTDTVLRHAYVGLNSNPFSSASTTFFAALGSAFGLADQGTVEARFQQYTGTAGTLNNLYIYIVSNTRTSNTTIRSRRSGTNGMIATVASGGTGISQDTANPVTVSATNLLNYSVATGINAGDIVPSIIASEFITTNSKALVLFGVPGGGLTQTSNLTRYVSVGGYCSASTPEANFQTKCLATCVASNLSVYLDSNTNNGTSTITLRSNGAATTLLVSITAGASGRISDTTDLPVITVNDLIDYEIATGGSAGTMDLRTISMTLDNSPISSGGSAGPAKGFSRIF